MTDSYDESTNSMGMVKHRTSCTQGQAIIDCVDSFQVKHSLPLGLKIDKFNSRLPTFPHGSKCFRGPPARNLQPLGDPIASCNFGNRILGSPLGPQSPAIHRILRAPLPEVVR